MAEVLSQSEIDALLNAVSSGAVDTKDSEGEAGGTGARRTADWIEYDLTSQEKVVRNKLLGLQGIHERFARLFRISLSTELKKSITVNATNVDFLRFGDYLSNILLPTSMNIIEMANLKGFMLFTVSSKLAYSLVDAYYGGSERPFSKIGGREEFTSIENSMIRKITQIAMHDLEQAWKLNYPLMFNYVRAESNPQFVGSIHSSELVAVVSFDVEFENLSGPFVLIIQLRALDPILSHLSVNVTGELPVDENAWHEHWMKELLTMELDLRVELGKTEKSLNEIQKLQVGDTLILRQDAVEPLSISLEQVPKLKGLMGTYRGNSAVRLIEDVSPTENNLPKEGE
jgi:flagellar motor switch protein FliM